MSNRLVPKLRFNGFNSEWKNKYIKDISKVIGGGTPSTKVKDYWNGNINWYSPDEISKNDSPYVYKSKNKISEEGLKYSSAKLHPAHTTILFTSRANIGSMSILKNDAATNQGFQSLELNSNMSPYFIYSDKDIIKHKALKMAHGSTFLEISKRELEGIILSIPSVSEQQKIGQFFSKLDRLIDLQSQKLSHLKQLKKGYLQKMFPQKGESVPMLRFDGFRDEWKKIKIIDALNYEQPSKYIVDNDKYYDKGIPVLTANQSFVLGYTHENNVYDKANCIIFDDFTEDFKYVDFPFKVKSSALKILTSKNDFDIYFMYNNLQTTHLIHEGHSRHYISNVQNHNIYVPKIKEQIKISAFFAELDKSINNKRYKLDRLKKLKKAYLQKMFI